MRNHAVEAQALKPKTFGDNRQAIDRRIRTRSDDLCGGPSLRPVLFLSVHLVDVTISLTKNNRSHIIVMTTLFFRGCAVDDFLR